MILPEGFAIPPTLYLLSLTLGIVLVVVAIVRLDPPVTEATVLAFAPWMALGGVLHALAVSGAVDPSIAPLLGTPAVYVSTAILAGVAWILAHRDPLDLDVSRPVPWVLGILGGIGFGIASIAILRTAVRFGTLSPGWPIVGIVVAIILTGAIWLGLERAVPAVPRTTGWAGVLVLFAHVLDGVSTSIGVDVLGAAERSPLPLFIMDLAAMLPTAGLTGVGWAFVLVKVALVTAILWLFVDFVRDAPRQAYLVLVVIAAVGLGPGVHNLVLFLLGG